MPNQAEYEAILDAEAQSALSRPVGSRRDVDAACAEARRRVTRKRDELTKDITVRWKDGFKGLKDENDQMQRDLKQAHRDVDQMIGERKGDMYEGIQK